MRIRVNLQSWVGWGSLKSNKRGGVQSEDGDGEVFKW